MASDLNQLPRVLVAHNVPAVRASVIERLRACYDCREERDGEGAWQVLVLDQSIQAVVADLKMPVLDGFGLLARVRNSRLARIRDIPVILICGEGDGEGGEDEPKRMRAKARSGSDFIGQTTGAAELQVRLDSLIRLRNLERELEANREQLVHNPETGLFTRKYIELQAAQALSHAWRHAGEASVMVLGFDRFDAVRAETGEGLLKQMQARFATLLSGKIRKEDCLGHYDESCFALVAPGTPGSSCVAFGNRLREAITAATIAVRGQKLTLSVSIGLANSSTDAVKSSAELLDLAAERLKLAMDAGGNRLLGSTADVPAVTPAPKLAQVFDALRSGRADAVRPHAGALFAEITPLLELIQGESGIALPLEALKARFRDRS